MTVDAIHTTGDSIAGWRDLYREEMACQVVHDSIHARPGWTDEYLLRRDGASVGYGSVAVAGPWSEAHAIYEFYVAREARQHLFPLFEALVVTSRATHIEVQSNDVLGLVMCHAFAGSVTSESILFHDRFTTALQPEGATFRAPHAGELDDVSASQEPWHGVVEIEGAVAASGGILFHYNRPYGDIYMQVEERFRRRGLGAFLVQELKRVAYAGGHIPAVRCNPSNVASQRTLQRAGFVPCGHILTGKVAEVGESHRRL
ncbi:MAG: GNAT family N-acetyltransferase [Cytophagaceae bacterium]|nr:GNAT family N-acetyltransferase [Gemmatimonadaceae bacterium]